MTGGCCAGPGGGPRAVGVRVVVGAGELELAGLGWPLRRGVAVAAPGVLSEGAGSLDAGDGVDEPACTPSRRAWLATADVITTHTPATTAMRATFHNIRNPRLSNRPPTNGALRQPLSRGGRVTNGSGAREPRARQTLIRW